MQKSRSLRIAPPTSTRVLSPGQKKFNALIAKIDVQRRLLLDWNEGLPWIEQRHAKEFVPLLDAYAQCNAELVRLLDRRADAKGLGKTDRQFLHQLICNLVGDLVEGPHGEEMKAIYNRHNPTDFDTQVKASQDGLRQMVQEEFGVELPDNALDASSPEEMMARLQDLLETQREQQETQRAQARSAQQQARRKPSARQLKAKAEEHNASQSIREVYRKLASALHPDREPVEAERVRKTALMQRVNQAYQKKDLLSLLQLQLEIEQIDQNALDGIAEDRLRHYNKVLTEQLQELQDEVQLHEHQFKQQYNLDPGMRVTPASMMKAFVQQKHHLIADTLSLERQLKALASDDMKYFKRWLKEQREMGQADDVLDALLAELGGGFR